MGVHERHCGTEEYPGCKYGDPDCPVCPISLEDQIKEFRMCIKWNDKKILTLSEEMLFCKRENDAYKKKVEELEEELIHDLFDPSNFEGRPNGG